jgi:hypothetical protein
MDTSSLKIGYCLSLSGVLASNGKTARLAHDIWKENVNKNGGLLGLPPEYLQGIRDGFESPCRNRQRKFTNGQRRDSRAKGRRSR